LPREERTEKATPKKREDVRKKEGMVARSADLTSGVMFLFSVFFLRLWGPSLFRYFASLLEGDVASAGGETTVSAILSRLRAGLLGMMGALAPLCLALAAMALLVNGLQVKLYFVPKAIKPRGERINPVLGLKRLFSPRSLVELAKNLLKVGLVGAVAYYSVRGDYARLHAITGAGAADSLSSYMGVIFNAAFKVALVMFAIGCADYGFQKWEFERNIMMTRQELKEEFRQTEGDPNLRAAIRSRMREIARRRMMQRLPQATMVITNPRHYAVALQYHRRMPAPRVIAKGADFLALRIREEAERLGIPVVEDPPLARALYDSVEVDQEIPPELYKAVAEVLAYLISVDRRMAARIA
jgi:flagellar biosynthetic protein FlhB